jgi:predicted ester cyclase
LTREDIIQAYFSYIDCLNNQDWSNLHRYVAEEVAYNGEVIGLAGYRNMLIGDFEAIPDLSFNVARFACDPPVIASSLAFDCTPEGLLFGFPVNGKRVQFTENVFYAFTDGRILNVWSVIDKAAIGAQI